MKQMYQWIWLVESKKTFVLTPCNSPPIYGPFKVSFKSRLDIMQNYSLIGNLEQPNRL